MSDTLISYLALMGIKQDKYRPKKKESRVYNYVDMCITTQASYITVVYGTKNITARVYYTHQVEEALQLITDFVSEHREKKEKERS